MNRRTFMVTIVQLLLLYVVRPFFSLRAEATNHAVANTYGGGGYGKSSYSGYSMHLPYVMKEK